MSDKEGILKGLKMALEACDTRRSFDFSEKIGITIAHSEIERLIVQLENELPEEIMCWRGQEKLDHTGTWSTTRYPEDAVAYVPKGSEYKKALQAIANLPTPVNEDVIQGHEDAFRAIAELE